MLAAEKAEEARREEKADTERRLAAGEKMYTWAEALAAIRKNFDAKELPAEKRKELKERIESLVKGKRKSA
jgi:hypothetical protein